MSNEPEIQSDNPEMDVIQVDDPINGEDLAQVDPPIQFAPPIQVSESVIMGGMVVSSAEVIHQDDTNQLVARIYGDGRVIGVAFNVNAEQSLRSALE